MKDSLQRAVAWLVRHQGEDGGWHSTTYGQLKDGAGVTALILYALRHESAQANGKRVAESVRRGFEFLGRGIAKRGTIASPDGTLDFPTYAAALWLVADRALQLTGRFSGERYKLVEYLVAAQIKEERGFDAKSPSYGGWDFLGKEDARGITTGTNISVTCYVLEALKRSDLDWKRSGDGQAVLIAVIKSAFAAIERAKAYVLRCRQPDGGFAFTCEPGSLNNKALFKDEKLTQPRAYGTATCDGIRALMACGMKGTDEPVARALAWVAKRPGLEVVPGFEGLPPEAGWQRGLRFYYYASLARVLPLLPEPSASSRREALAQHVVGLQKADGSWVNESDRMRENDPLIATALAVDCLGNLAIGI